MTKIPNEKLKKENGWKHTDQLDVDRIARLQVQSKSLDCDPKTCTTCQHHHHHYQHHQHHRHHQHHWHMLYTGRNTRRIKNTYLRLPNWISIKSYLIVHVRQVSSENRSCQHITLLKKHSCQNTSSTVFTSTLRTHFCRKWHSVALVAVGSENNVKVLII